MTDKLLVPVELVRAAMTRRFPPLPRRSSWQRAFGGVGNGRDDGLWIRRIEPKTLELVCQLLAP
jgi:hypothetical protein